MDPIIIDLDSIEDAEIEEVVTGVSMSIAGHDPNATGCDVIHQMVNADGPYAWGYRVTFDNGHGDFNRTFMDDANDGHHAALDAACEYARRALALLERERRARRDLEHQLRERGGR